MLVKPDLEDATITAWLSAAYGLRVVRLEFLPLGNDRDTAVYRATDEGGTPYFCKLRLGPFAASSVALPKLLSGQGVASVIAPVTTRTGQLWAAAPGFKLILYPFVAGTSGYETELSERQWATFGETLKRLHAARLPPALRRALRRERYSPEWRKRCASALARLEHPHSGAHSDGVAAEAAAFLRPRRELVLFALGRAERLAAIMAASKRAFVPCHSDVHPGNLLLTAAGELYVVDWDDPVLAPRERDLMFIGGGQGFVACSAEREEALFYRGYGAVRRDAEALAYYRLERVVTDIAVDCERILSETLSDDDRAQTLDILKYYFLPGATLELALGAAS